MYVLCRQSRSGTLSLYSTTWIRVHPWREKPIWNQIHRFPSCNPDADARSRNGISSFMSPAKSNKFMRQCNYTCHSKVDRFALRMFRIFGWFPSPSNDPAVQTRPARLAGLGQLPGQPARGLIVRRWTGRCVQTLAPCPHTNRNLASMTAVSITRSRPSPLTHLDRSSRADDASPSRLSKLAHHYNIQRTVLQQSMVLYRARSEESFTRNRILYTPRWRGPSAISHAGRPRDRFLPADRDSLATRRWRRLGRWFCLGTTFTFARAVALSGKSE